MCILRNWKVSFKDMYRYRPGNLRILYEVHEDIKTIRIKAIEARGSIYK